MLKFKNYKIELSNVAKKDLKKLEIKIVIKIQKQLNNLLEESPNLDIKKLEGLNSNLYRLRCGDYRIIFEIIDSETTILILAIDHRKDIYKGLSVLITWLSSFFS